MIGVYENVVPYGDTTATEYLLEDWVWEEAAIANNLSFEAFEALPQEKQDKLIDDYLKAINIDWVN